MNKPVNVITFANDVESFLHDVKMMRVFQRRYFARRRQEDFASKKAWERIVDEKRERLFEYFG